MAGSPDLVRQRQTGQEAAANIGYHHCRQYAAESERLRKARLRVENAIKEKKIFAVQGPYPVIRRLLRARGWVERKLPRNGRQLKQQPGDQSKRQLEARASGGGDEQGKAVLSPRGGTQPSLGTAEPLQHPWPRDKENKGQREDEDTKEDMEQCNEDSDDIHNLMSFLVQDQVPNFLWTIHLSSIDQELLPRIEMVNRYPRLSALCTKEGLCQSLQNLPWFEQVDFNTFFPRCYRLGLMDEQEAFTEDFLLTAARSLLKLALQKVRDRPVGTEQPPESDKVSVRGPGWCWAGSSRSGASTCCSAWRRSCHSSAWRATLTSGSSSPAPNPVAGWFLVTDWKPLTVWFYRDCYLRFCSWPFSLCHLEPARHLCNVSIQKRYKTSQPDSRVPPDKIWSNKQFQAHLAQLGQANAWQQVMVPGMKAAILNALRCTRDQVGSRKGSFELFGADFLIGEDFQPWLLEINSCPTMSPSSAVTRRLCANVQRDTLRLVLDRKDNPTCSIGAFELLYREAPVSSCLTVGLKLMVTGRSLKKPQLAKHRSQDKPSTTVLNPQLPAPSGDRATKVPWSRAAQEKLPPLGLQSSCSLPKSDPPALPQPLDCSAGGQELPWLLHLVVGQPKEAQPQEAPPQTALLPITSCSLDRGPVSPPRGATKSPWQPPGGSARSQELPWLLHLVGQAEDAQPQLAHTQEAQPPINSHPLDRLPSLQEAPRRPWWRPGSGSQGLTQLSQPGGQPQAARPHKVLPLINAHPPVRGPVPQPRGAPSRPWRPPGSAPAPAGLPARPVRLPAL
ncbi:tubulin tyrosine ligase 3-like isoform X5 [Vidua chalybeata]|uniref:tubulin tyrosine ligase 3-like isoform X5 n=1 Tax=Vidua chalybeata TaxID=81927 RepID=UPI0023A7F804|nr:tubulin tyrosine ligase 3-like isoform X5 [Vidua chalybeata]